MAIDGREANKVIVIGGDGPDAGPISWGLWPYGYTLTDMITTPEQIALKLEMMRRYPAARDEVDIIVIPELIETGPNAGGFYPELLASGLLDVAQMVLSLEVHFEDGSVAENDSRAFGPARVVPFRISDLASLGAVIRRAELEPDDA